MGRAFTFPGQGSQAVGMGQPLADAVPAAREVFEEVDDALNQNLSHLMWHGPIEELTLTANAQPALMAVSLAVVRVLERDMGLDWGTAVQFVAGHSLGEYSALAAAGMFTLSDAAVLLKARGQAMQQAVPVGEGAMAALLGLDFDIVVQIVETAAEQGVCVTASDNAPGQVVVSGTKAAVDYAIDLAKQAGAKRALPLTVSAPFHCSLMAPAAEVMARELEQVAIAPPRVPLVANVTASPVSDPSTIRSLLVEQVTNMVRWRESVARMVSEGVDTFVEIGAGKTLSGLAKRIDRDVTIRNLEMPQDLEAFAKEI